VAVALDPIGEEYRTIKDNPAAYKTLRGLSGLQHRGQEAVGLAALHPSGRIHLRRALGLVDSLEKRRGTLEKLGGNVAIGHVRYSTVGSGSVCDAQPNVIRMNGMMIAGAHNGNVINPAKMRRKLRKYHKFTGKGDGEIITAAFALEYIRAGRDIEKAYAELAKQVANSSYSMVVMTSRGEVAAFRDPYGFRPLAIGKGNEGVMIASETVALENGGFGYWRPVGPGELIVVQDDGQSISTKQVLKPTPAHCWFEWDYFSNPASRNEGVSVSEVRRKLGRELAQKYGAAADADIVVPVPDTGRTATEEIASALGLPLREGLIRNRYMRYPRTFIMPTPTERKKGRDMKFNIDVAALEGKKIILVEDSIVRGTTMHNLIDQLRKEGHVTRVEVWVTGPPIVSVCVYGIDMANPREFIAKGLSDAHIEQVRKEIGADRICYQKHKALERAIGLPICAGCSLGEYPTPGAQELVDSAVGVNFAGRITEFKPSKIHASPVKAELQTREKMIHIRV
jgi:amidophosphoribosyltransferase